MDSRCFFTMILMVTVCSSQVELSAWRHSSLPPAAVGSGWLTPRSMTATDSHRCSLIPCREEKPRLIRPRRLKWTKAVKWSTSFAQDKALNRHVQRLRPVCKTACQTVLKRSGKRLPISSGLEREPSVGAKAEQRTGSAPMQATSDPGVSRTRATQRREGWSRDRPRP